jgi:hypothetical protein
MIGARHASPLAQDSLQDDAREGLQEYTSVAIKVTWPQVAQIFSSCWVRSKSHPSCSREDSRNCLAAANAAPSSTWSVKLVEPPVTYLASEVLNLRMPPVPRSRGVLDRSRNQCRPQPPHRSWQW